jgi:hypothetical protein
MFFLYHENLYIRTLKVTMIGQGLRCFVLATSGGRKARPLHCSHSHYRQEENEALLAMASLSSEGSGTIAKGDLIFSYGNEVSLEVLDDHDGNAGSAGGMKSNAEATKLDESCHLREPFERYLDMSFGVDEYSMAAFSAKEDLGMWMRSLMTHLQVHFIAPCSRSQ